MSRRLVLSPPSASSISKGDERVLFLSSLSHALPLSPDLGFLPRESSRRLSFSIPRTGEKKAFRWDAEFTASNTIFDTVEKENRLLRLGVLGAVEMLTGWVPVLGGTGGSDLPLKLVGLVRAPAVDDSGSSSNMVFVKLGLLNKAEEEFGETGYKCRASGGARAEYGGIGATDLRRDAGREGLSVPSLGAATC